MIVSRSVKKRNQYAGVVGIDIAHITFKEYESLNLTRGLINYSI